MAAGLHESAFKSPDWRPCNSSQNERFWADCHTGMKASQCYRSYGRFALDACVYAGVVNAGGVSRIGK